MKKFLFLFLIAFVFAFPANAFGQIKWKTYANARYGYSISYPANLLVPQPEADNGDGRIFSNNAAEMRVFGTHALLNETLLKEYNAVVKESENVSYKVYRKNFFVVSGTSDGRIFYQKTMAKANGIFVTFRIEYAEDERAEYDKITARIVADLK